MDKLSQINRNPEDQEITNVLPSIKKEPKVYLPEGFPQPMLEYSDKNFNIEGHFLHYSMKYDPTFTICYK